MAQAAPYVADARRHAAEPPSLAGFGHVSRFYDPRMGRVAAKILPGEFYATTAADEVITTVLGSCVSACIWDPEAGIGGMNHFMVSGDPDGSRGPRADDAGRYGMFAMELLINTLLTSGARRSHLLVKLAGGSHVLDVDLDIGAANVAFARSYIAAEGLVLTGEHVGGPNARLVAFDPLTGRSRVMELSTEHEGTVVRRESAYAASLGTQPVPAGSVELF